MYVLLELKDGSWIVSFPESNGKEELNRAIKDLFSRGPEYLKENGFSVKYEERENAIYVVVSKKREAYVQELEKDLNKLKDLEKEDMERIIESWKGKADYRLISPRTG